MYGPSSQHGDVLPAAGSPARGPSAFAAKIVITGGFGVGKTTLIATITEIAPLMTEAAVTEASRGIDHLGGRPDKTTTTVALDFGRITLDDSLILYLFGTPGQDRFSFLWDDLVEGALGAVVLVDTERVDDCFPAVDYLEEREMPFLLAVNRFEGAVRFDLDEVREAVGIAEHVPIMEFDARQRSSVKEVMATLVEQVLLARTGQTVG